MPSSAQWCRTVIAVVVATKVVARFEQAYGTVVSVIAKVVDVRTKIYAGDTLADGWIIEVVVVHHRHGRC